MRCAVQPDPRHRSLTAADVTPQAARRVPSRVITLDNVDSTNAWLLQRAAVLPDGAACFAEHQSAGRGRQGRAWEAPRGASVLLSVLLLEPPDSCLLPRVTRLAAVAACEAVLDAVPDCAARVRWPNDLVVAGRKLGGVLAETTPARRPDGAAARAIALGVGVNCLQQAGHFSEALRPHATSLELSSQRPIDRPAVARALLERLDAWLAQPVQHMQRRWSELCDDLGQAVRVMQGGVAYQGVICGIDPAGDLLVDLADGQRSAFAAATTTRLW